MNRRIAVLLVLGILPWAGAHAQQTASTILRVSASVQSVCEVAATDLGVDPAPSQSGTRFRSTTLLRATCSPNSSYNIGLNVGTSPGATGSQRKVVNTIGRDTVTGVGTGRAQDHTVFGSVPASQVIPAGEYGDTITVRVFY